MAAAAPAAPSCWTARAGVGGMKAGGLDCNQAFHGRSGPNRGVSKDLRSTAAAPAAAPSCWSATFAALRLTPPPYPYRHRSPPPTQRHVHICCCIPWAGDRGTPGPLPANMVQLPGQCAPSPSETLPTPPVANPPADPARSTHPPGARPLPAPCAPTTQRHTCPWPLLCFQPRAPSPHPPGARTLWLMRPWAAT